MANFNLPSVEDETIIEDGIYQAETIEEIKYILEKIRKSRTTDWTIALRNLFFMKNDGNIYWHETDIDKSTNILMVSCFTDARRKEHNCIGDLKISLSSLFVKVFYESNKLIRAELLWNNSNTPASPEKFDNIFRVNF